MREIQWTGMLTSFCMKRSKQLWVYTNLSKQPVATTTSEMFQPLTETYSCYLYPHTIRIGEEQKWRSNQFRCILHLLLNMFINWTMTCISYNICSQLIVINYRFFLAISSISFLHVTCNTNTVTVEKTMRMFLYFAFDCMCMPFHWLFVSHSWILQAFWVHCILYIWCKYLKCMQ